jgi:hypothetical protein
MLHPDDQHLAPLESAARFYCAHRGVNSDDQIAVRAQTGLILPGAATRKRAAWLFIADELIDLHIRLQALNIAREEITRGAQSGPRVQ